MLRAAPTPTRGGGVGGRGCAPPGASPTRRARSRYSYLRYVPDMCPICARYVPDMRLACVRVPSVRPGATQGPRYRPMLFMPILMLTRTRTSTRQESSSSRVLGSHQVCRLSAILASRASRRISWACIIYSGSYCRAPRFGSGSEPRASPSLPPVARPSAACCPSSYARRAPPVSGWDRRP